MGEHAFSPIRLGPSTLGIQVSILVTNTGILSHELAHGSINNWRLYWHEKKGDSASVLHLPNPLPAD
jgi:hypothetical protein